MKVSPIGRPPLGRQLVAQLRAQIVGGELAPGTHLVEGWIAEHFEVSRGPVREALRELELEGLVETRRRGVFVLGLSDRDLVELYALRGALEGLAVRETIAKLAEGDAAGWLHVDDALARMRVAADAGAPAEFAAADLDFHSAFYEIGGNRKLAATWATYRPLFASMLDVTNTRDRDLHPVAQDHARLADIVRSGDADAAIAELSEHLEGSRERMCAALAGLTPRSA